MANNKVLFGNTPLVDLTADTATPATVLKDTVFLGNDGTTKTGAFEQQGGSPEVHNVNLSIPGKTYEIPKWSTGTDADIQVVLEKHYTGKLDLTDYWKVGDKRTIQLSAMSAYAPFEETQPQQNVDFYLLNVGGKTLATPINSHTECAFVVGQATALETLGKYDAPTSGWAGGKRREWANNTYRGAFPSSIVDIFKEFEVLSADGFTANTKTTNDYFAFYAEKEVYGVNTQGSSVAESELGQFELFVNNSIRTNLKGWNRTPSYLHGRSYWSVCGENRSVCYYEYTYAGYLTPFGVI